METKTHRLTVDITEAQYNGLRRHLDRGYQRRVFQVLIDDLIEALDRFGIDLLMMLLAKHMRVTDLYTKELHDHRPNQSYLPSAFRGPTDSSDNADTLSPPHSWKEGEEGSERTSDEDFQEEGEDERY